MKYFSLIWAQLFRSKTRTLLTLLSVVAAFLLFGLLDSVRVAFNAGGSVAGADRLVVASRLSITQMLPYSLAARIDATPGVKKSAYAAWFGGIYKDPKNFFVQFAIDPSTYLDLYPEFVLSDVDRRDFLRDRKGVMVGEKLAATYGFKRGDTVTLKGTIYPGEWDFIVRAIYTGRDARTDVAQMLFHWDYLNETMKVRVPRRGNQVGVYIVEVGDPARAAEVSRAIDAEFRNSNAETLTETEKAFQLGFVSMTEAIVVAIRVVSYLVIFIILAVMANTMAMTARERTAEYATLKALGFGPAFVMALIYGESLAIAGIGGAVGIALTFPVADAFAKAMGTLFPVFVVSKATLCWQIACAAAVGLVAAALPAFNASRVKIVDGLRSIG
jgi:putative ABC transport system permease protein